MFSLQTSCFRRGIALLLACLLTCGIAFSGCRRTDKVDALIEQLSDKDFTVIKEVAKELGKIKDPRAIEPLIKVLMTAGYEERSHSGTSLHPLYELRDCVSSALGSMGHPAVESLIARVKDSDKEMRAGAIYALGQIKDPLATDPLILALKDKDSRMRCEAADALGKIKDVRAINPLIAALKDRSWENRGYAADALGEIKDPRAIDALIASFKDPDGEVQGRAGVALRSIGGTAFQRLIIALKDIDRDTRLNAAEALGDTRDSRATKPLIAALEDEDPWVQGSVVGALAHIGDKSSQKRLLKALNSLGAEVVERHYYLIIEAGIPDSEGALVESLNEQDKSREAKWMAQRFLHCGNKRLADAAQEWALNHGVLNSEMSDSMLDEVRWGQRPKAR